MQGNVVRVVRDKGYGFIKTDTGYDVFFHYSALPEGLFDNRVREGTRLAFDVTDDPRGRGQRATNIQILD